jgi:plasmid stability protein
MGPVLWAIVDKQPFWCNNATRFNKEGNMPSITVKNIPQDLYEKIKVSASLNHRSLNNEMISCIESVLMPQRLSVSDKLLRAQKLRALFSSDIAPDEIRKAVEEGRE